MLSLTALIFSGRLAVFLPQVIPAVLLGDALLVTTVTVLSSYGGAIAVVQDAPSAVLAGAVAGLAAAMPANASSEQLLPTVLVLLVGSTLVMGAVYLALGWFKLGGLVRFLPYPVLGGFLAGTGWLLTLGGVGVATGVPLGTGLLQPAALAHWLPAVLLGLAMLVAANRWKSPLVLAAAAVRLETMQGGRVIGELGFFLGTRRNASAVADRPTVAYCLTRAAWGEIQANHPNVAQTLTGVVIHLLGQRVQHLTRAVEALQRQETTITDPGMSAADG